LVEDKRVGSGKVKAWKKGAVIGGVLGFLYASFLWIVLSIDFRFVFIFLLPVLGALVGTVIGILIQSYRERKLKE
jgi:cytosine/uracil/thiamine/allantoin permease